MQARRQVFSPRRATRGRAREVELHHFGVSGGVELDTVFVEQGVEPATHYAVDVADGDMLKKMGDTRVGFRLVHTARLDEQREVKPVCIR